MLHPIQVLKVLQVKTKGLWEKVPCLVAPLIFSNLTSDSSSDESSESLSAPGREGGITVFSSCKDILRMCCIPALIKLRSALHMTYGFKRSNK